MSEDVQNFLRESIEQKLDEMEITNATIDLTPGSTIGDNYLAVITLATIKGTNKKGKNITLNWIAKSCIQNKQFREALNIRSAYEREIFMYNKVFPAFEAFQKKVAVFEPFDNYPKYIEYSMKMSYEMLIMENLKCVGYQIRDRKEPLNYEHCVLVMKQYGKLHALSLALRHQNPEEFQKLASHLQSNLMAGIAKEHMQPSYDMRCDKIMEHLDPEKYSMELEKIKKLKPRCFDIMSNKINSSTNDRHAVIIHGDSWINNMLFRYDEIENPKKPTKACLLDFQLSQMGSPAMDLSYFIFACTDKKLRDEHYEDLLQQYYSSLSSFLRELGTDPNEAFPYRVLLEHMKTYSAYGFIMAMIVVYLMLSDSDEIPDYANDANLEEFSTRNIKQFSHRINGVLQDFVKYDYEL